MLLLGRDIAYGRSTACTRDVLCGKTFSSRDNLARRARGTVCIKSEDKIISTVLQDHSWLETHSLLVTARARAVRHIALFSSRDVASRSRRYEL